MLKQLARLQIQNRRLVGAFSGRNLHQSVFCNSLLNSDFTARRQYSQSRSVFEESANRFAKAEGDKEKKSEGKEKDEKVNPAEGKAYSLESIEYEISSAQVSIYVIHIGTLIYLTIITAEC